MPTRPSLFFSLLTTLLTAPVAVLAQTQTSSPTSGLESIVKGPMAAVARIGGYGNGPPPLPLDLISGWIGLTLGFVGVIFLILAIYGGFQWMTAGGNEQQVTDAKNRLQNGVIGVVIIMVAYVLTSAVIYEMCQFAVVGTCPV